MLFIITLASAIAGCCFFSSNPTITIICAIISLVVSIINILIGAQNNLVVEIVTLIVGLLISLIFEFPILSTMALVVCIANLITAGIGTIIMIIGLINR